MQPATFQRHTFDGEKGGTCRHPDCGLKLETSIHRMRVGGGEPLYQQANAYVASLKLPRHRAYADGLIAYYRGWYMGADEAENLKRWPTRWETLLPATTRVRINNTIRHYLVGDCPMPSKTNG